MNEFKGRWLAIALLSLRTNPPPSLAAAFALGVLLLSLIGSVLAAWVIGPDTINADVLGRFLILFCVMLFLAIAAVANYYDGLNKGAGVSELSSVKPMPYVITALSPFQEFVDKQGIVTGNNLEVVVRLVKHHQGSLEKIFLVAAFDHDEYGGLERAYQQLLDETRKLFGDRYSPDLLEKLLIQDPNSAEYAFQEVRNLLAAKLSHVREKTIIDITAATKPITIGLTLAGIADHVSVSYQATPRGEDGLPIQGAKAVLSQLRTDLIVLPPQSKPPMVNR